MLRHLIEGKSQVAGFIRSNFSGIKRQSWLILLVHMLTEADDVLHGSKQHQKNSNACKDQEKAGEKQTEYKGSVRKQSFTFRSQFYDMKSTLAQGKYADYPMVRFIKKDPGCFIGQSRINIFSKSIRFCGLAVWAALVQQGLI